MTPEPLHDVEALAGLAERASPPRLRLARIALRLLSVLCVLSVAALAGGFLRFVTELEEEGAPPPRSDAIVALTGGSERISDAVDLLAGGRADRLLITGVNRATSPERLANTLPQHRELFDCCIDMDYQARNTVGNAVETRRWAESRHVRSLIVVTSSYHMPRALIELQRAMPGVTLRPHSVTPDKVADGGGWRNLLGARILATEYGKFLAAYVRASLFPQLAVDPTVTGSLRRKTSRLVEHGAGFSAN